MVHSLGKTCFQALIVSILLMCMVFPDTSYAQSLGEISLNSSPEVPGPFEKVTVSLDQYGVNTFGSNIRWYVDDAEQTEYRNARSVSFVTGPVGKRMDVRISVSQTNGLALTKVKTIIPASVDLVLESNTYVPYFYRGRALPSKESLVSAIAVFHGGSSSALDYTYKWSLGTSVLFGGPVKGKYRADFEMPLFDGDRLTVEVFDVGGELVAKNFVKLNSQNPELYFYEHSPLRGLLGKAIGNELSVFGEETTISAEPYYIHTDISSPETRYGWEVDGKKIAQGGGEPNEITLRKTGDSGSAHVGLEIITTLGLPQFLENSFRLFFN